jgi:hypothetical protein
MISLLGGSYAFCLYDARQGRVLAARDPSGVVPLLEGRTAQGGLLVCSRRADLPEGAHGVVEMPAGAGAGGALRPALRPPAPGGRCLRAGAPGRAARSWLRPTPS